MEQGAQVKLVQNHAAPKATTVANGGHILGSRSERSLDGRGLRWLLFASFVGAALWILTSYTDFFHSEWIQHESFDDANDIACSSNGVLFHPTDIIELDVWSAWR